MRRIYEYHGAEHKTIHAYENGGELNLQNIKTHSPLHPRCGTSFLLIVMVISILTFSFIPQEWAFIHKFLSRLILVPLIAGLSFEFLKLSSKMKKNIVKSTGFKQMRRLAEQRLRDKAGDKSGKPLDDAQQLIHELEVHQIEL